MAEDRVPLLAREAAASVASDDGSAAASTEEGWAGPAPPGAASATAAAHQQAAAAAPAPACRICLQDDDPSSLEAPCSCSGSMEWAHHACIQRWIDEKHDKQCEVCKQQFRGAYRDPPPRPPPTPLVAQLQVDNNDNRIVLLADPETGAIVARVVVPPGGELPEDGFPWTMHPQGGAADSDSDEEEDEEEQGGGGGRLACSPLLLLLLMACILGAFAWLARSEDGPGAEGAQAGAWFVRVMLLTIWIYLRSMRPVVPRRLRSSEMERRRRVTFADLEAGLQQRRQQQHTPQPQQ